MALLSRKVDYALLILSHLHQNGESSSARAIAEQFELSRAFVANILKQLCSADFLTSERGTKGGYSLARSADSIHLLAVMEALDDPFFLEECCQEGSTDVPVESNPTAGCAIFRSCPIRGPIQHIHNKLLAVLQNVTVAELANQPEQTEVPVILGTSLCERPPKAHSGPAE